MVFGVVLWQNEGHHEIQDQILGRILYFKTKNRNFQFQASIVNSQTSVSRGSRTGRYIVLSLVFLSLS